MIIAADLFCGGGGTSSGLVRAVRQRGLHLDLLAINHWTKAVATHTRNHPWARHVCADLASVEADPSKLIPGGKLDILVASPECTHFSNARGDVPCSDQSRASAWHVLHWATRLSINEILIENIKEFRSWGPLLNRTIRYKGKTYRKGRPDPRRRGETFIAFLSALESLGYWVDYKVLNAADYGDVTTRHRIFIRASRRGLIRWPEPTHDGRWRAAAEVIDWNIKGRSIFNRKKPLAKKTLDRIEAGLRKFGGEAFIAVLRGTDERKSGSWAKSVSEPLGTVSAGGIHAALCEPFVLGQQSCSAPRSVNDPLPTVAAAGAIALCQPFVIPMEHGGKPRLRSTDEPLPTITTARGGAFGLCEPFVLNVAHEGGDRVRSTREPLSTIPAGHRGELALCEPFLTKYYGSARGAQSIAEPVDTITAKDRLALVEPRGMDILFRMLQPHELAAAMGFEDYHFEGTKTDAVRMIGNAVPVNTAAALCGSMIDGRGRQ